MPLQTHTPNPVSQGWSLMVCFPIPPHIMSSIMGLLYPDVPERVEVEQDNIAQELQPFQTIPSLYLHVTLIPHQGNLVLLKVYRDEVCTNIEYLFMTVIFNFQYNKNTHIP